MAFHNRAAGYAAKGDYDHAIGDLDQVIQFDPKNAKVFNDRGVGYAAKAEMWKPEHRRAAERRGLRYPSDLTDTRYAGSRRRSARPQSAHTPHLPLHQFIFADPRRRAEEVR